MNSTVNTFIRTIGLMALLLLIILTPTIDMTDFTLKGLIFFIILSTYTDSFPVQLPKGGTVSVSVVVIFACITLFGPAVSAYVVIFATIFSKLITRDKSPWIKLVFNCAQLCLAAGLAGIIYQLLGGSKSGADVTNLLPFLGAASIYIAVNCTAVSLILSLSQGMSLSGVWLTNVRWVLPNFVMLAPLGLLIANVYLYTGPLGVSLFFIPLLLARFIFKSYMEMRQNYLDTLGALASALDAKDAYTKGHSDRVSEYATMIARTMAMPEDQVEVLQHLALLHDIGKIGVSDEILCKPDRLSDEEFDSIKQHSAIGEKIVESIQGLGQNKEYILFHHERFNGGGYPTGLTGEDIPLGARIITVADAFDAMTSDRSYRPRMSFSEACKELQTMSGVQFDPQVVQAFLVAMEKEQNPNGHYMRAISNSE